MTSSEKEDQQQDRSTKALTPTLAALPADLTELQLLNVRAVAALIGRSITSVHDLVRAGRFPAPVRDGPRCTRWPAGKVRAWLLEQAANVDDQAQQAKQAASRARGMANKARAKRSAAAEKGVA